VNNDVPRVGDILVGIACSTPRKVRIRYRGCHTFIVHVPGAWEIVPPINGTHPLLLIKIQYSECRILDDFRDLVLLYYNIEYLQDRRDFANPLTFFAFECPEYPTICDYTMFIYFGTGFALKSTMINDTIELIYSIPTLISYPGQREKSIWQSKLQGC
jgi:hypothetical protein